MTSNKDLEERIKGVNIRLDGHITNDSRHWTLGMEIWLIVAVLLSVSAFVICLTYLDWRSNLIEASPCELGLMEWEEPKIVMDFSNHCSKYGVDSQIIEWWSVIEEEAGCKWVWEGKNTCKCVSKSCPYTGEIMVVKE